jgi:hypothetical protein
MGVHLSVEEREKQARAGRNGTRRLERAVVERSAFGKERL